MRFPSTFRDVLDRRRCHRLSSDGARSEYGGAKARGRKANRQSERDPGFLLWGRLLHGPCDAFLRPLYFRTDGSALGRVFRVVQIDQIEQPEIVCCMQGRPPVTSRFNGASNPHSEDRIIVA